MKRLPCLFALLLWPALAMAQHLSPEAVVREDARALNASDAVALLKLFPPEAKVFSRPADPDQLTGELSTQIGTDAQRRETFPRTMANGGGQRGEIEELLAVGDLVAARFKMSIPPAFTEVVRFVVLYRVHEGHILRLWHVLRTDADAAAEALGRATIQRLAEANNRGDVEAFLALFSEQAKNFRNSGHPDRLGDKPSVRIVDAASRRAVYQAMFAKGPPVQVVTQAMLALGNLVVAHDVATRPDGKVLDELSVYRIDDKGLITHDWFIHEQERG